MQSFFSDIKNQIEDKKENLNSGDILERGNHLRIIKI